MPDGRTVAWTAWGDPAGVPLLRVPGTPGSRYSIRGRPDAVARAQPLRDHHRATGVRSLHPAARPQVLRARRRPGQDPGPGGAGPRRSSPAAAAPARTSCRSCPATRTGYGPQPSPRGQRRCATRTSPDMIEINQQSVRLGAGPRRRRAACAARATAARACWRTHSPRFAAVMASAPADDQAVMSDPVWQATFVRAQRESLGRAASTAGSTSASP